MARLKEYDWPGNIRDLQNVIERAVILCNGRELVVPWQFDATTVADQEVRPNTGLDVAPPSNPGPLGALNDVEKQHIIATLKQTHGVIDGPRGAAVILGLKPSTARFRMRKLGINKSDYVD